MADFNNIQTPDFARAALGGYAAGQAMGKARRRDDALALYGRDPNAGIEALNGVDPALAEQLRENAERREVAAQTAKIWEPAPQPALGQAPTPSPMAPALGSPPQPVPSAAPQTAPAGGLQPLPQPVTVYGKPINMEALTKLASLPGGAEGAAKVFALIKEGTEQQQKAFEKHAEAKGRVYLHLQQYGKTPEERAALYQQILPQAQAMGFIPSPGERFDDATIAQTVALAQTTQQALQEQRAARTEARTERRAMTAEERAARAEGRAQVRFNERDKDRAAIAASGGGRIPTDISDLDY